MIKNKNNNHELLNEELKQKLIEHLKELNNELEFKRLQANLVLNRLFEDEGEVRILEWVILGVNILIVLLLLLRK